MGRPLKPLEELGRTIAASQDRELGSVVARARERLLDPARPARRAPKKANRAWVAAAAAIAIAAALVFVIQGRSRAPLTFDVSSSRGTVGKWVLAPEEEQLPMHFSDGATILLSPRAYGQVAEITPDGARVTIASGRAAVSVPRTPGARYRFDIGPFVVAVTGTRFDTSWDPASSIFELDLKDGSVRVTGPTLDGERVVVAGQHLRIAVAISEEVISDAVPPERIAIVDAAPSASAPPIASVKPPPPSAIASGPPPWRHLSEEGHYAEALAAVSPHFDALTTSSPSGDVLALADTARLAGDPARAKQAYLAVRRRFPGAGDAALAAFWLGRTAVQENSDVEAARWFETYLHERPDDRLSREALGRLMEARDRHGEAAAAKALAAQYLAKYPDGPHAKLARKLERD